jgi:hypothetical protein
MSTQTITCSCNVQPLLLHAFLSSRDLHDVPQQRIITRYLGTYDDRDMGVSAFSYRLASTLSLSIPAWKFHWKHASWASSTTSLCNKMSFHSLASRI